MLKFIAKVRETNFIVDALRREHAGTVHTPRNIVAVARSVRRNPSISAHHRSQELNISRTSLCRIMRKDLGMLLYKVQLV